MCPFRKWQRSAEKAGLGVQLRLSGNDCKGIGAAAASRCRQAVVAAEAGLDKLHAAALAASGTASLLLRHGASVHHRSNEGRTALLWAVVGGDEAIVRMVLAAGARADALDHDGDGAVSLAERRGLRGVAELLRQHGREWWRDLHVELMILAQAQDEIFEKDESKLSA